MNLSRKMTLVVSFLLIVGLAIGLLDVLAPDGKIAPTGTTNQATTTAIESSTAVSTTPSSAQVTPSVTTSAVSTPLPATDGSSAAPAKPALLGTIEIEDGDMLERDIIPQLSAVFSLSETAVKEALSSPIPSILIRDNLTGFRRLEGIAPPGHYDIPMGSRLTDWIRLMVKAAENRYETMMAGVKSPNTLKPYERIILSSLVEAECLADEYHTETAAVFLNRIEKSGKLQSCVTAEYALGYQRPFMNSEDLKVQSPYNTYIVGGLPAGPICSVDDESLLAAISRSSDRALYFYFYDYVLGEMYFFSDYTKFQTEAAVSRERFLAGSTVGLRDKINKQVLYG